VTDAKALLKDLKLQVKAAEADLAKQVKAVPEVGAKLRTEYDQARKLGRTADTWNSWLDARVTQVAVAWVLGTVFVRFCEDNRLIAEPYLAASEDDRRDLVQARYEAYVDEDPDPTYRGWLERAFAEIGAGQAGRLLFDRKHNALYQIPISHDGARALVEFWRERDESGALVHDFEDPLNEDGTEGWDTRFMGDLYQDLSEAARKMYALLQTPEFVEEFILDRTMDPAVREFGYEGLKMIDPTCGSGHFVLGAFWRLVRLWAEGRPGTDVHERVRAALESVHGVDLNPFAVAIARFRLLVAAMAASGVRTLAEAGRYDWPIQLAVGDSLIKARQLEIGLFGEETGDPLAEFSYATEDVHEFPGILEPGRYHVVVGNPPYITVKDKRLNELYRELYDACFREYALSIPFAQRFFELAKQGNAQGCGYGMVGQITSNSFMKREFGKRLIESYFRDRVELTEIIDTSGAYIPGHGTPTVILVGRRREGRSRSVALRTVRGIQGEPETPENPAEGLVWRAIREQINKENSESEWVSVVDLRRDDMSTHPWSLAGGAAVDIMQHLAEAASRLSDVVEEIGLSVVTGEDSAFEIAHTKAIARHGIPVAMVADGQNVRDWDLQKSAWLANPYREVDFALESESNNRMLLNYLWPLRRILELRKKFSVTLLERGVPWVEWREVYRARLSAAMLIAFPLVATHNHFYLQRAVVPSKHSVTVIKLRGEAREEEYLRLLALLNSSTVCFWLKMVSHNKGSTVDVKGARQSTVPFEDFYEFTGTKLRELPLPAGYPAVLAAEMDYCAKRLAGANPSVVAGANPPTASRFREARTMWEATRAEMIGLQEELDWQTYALYDLYPEDLRAAETHVPRLALGERAFEIVLARRVAVGEASDEWFRRHNSTPITEIPANWPASYREVVQKRIDAIESSRAIGMIERPEYKRRWASEGWDSLQEKALRSWLLDRIETCDHWADVNGQPTLVPLSRLTDALSRDEDFVSVAALYAPRKELAAVVTQLLSDEHVPFLPALRYKPSGLKKRQDWEEVWDLQRQEDAAPDEPAKRKIRDSIPVPPKYTSADFLRPSYWRARGKLDVPKERFISYAQTNAPTPDLYGWAGWDHREQAQALATYFTNHPLSTEEITPFLAGMLELQPWLGQWHNEFDVMYSGSPADFFAAYRQQKQGEHGLTDDALRAWRPAAATRGRRAKS
jgi:hypothetical protein